MKLGFYEFKKHKTNKYFKNISFTYVLKGVIHLENVTLFFKWTCLSKLQQFFLNA